MAKTDRIHWPHVGVYLALALVAAFTVNTFSPRGIALIGSWDTAGGVITAHQRNDPVAATGDLQVKDMDRVKSFFDKGDSLFVDARAADSFAAGHIRGAWSLPLRGFDESIGPFLEQVPPDHPLVIYCSGRECTDSHELASLLKEMGYTRLQVFIDGYRGWRDAGYPVEP